LWTGVARADDIVLPAAVLAELPMQTRALHTTTS
jgi:hypothetical protein